MKYSTAQHKTNANYKTTKKNIYTPQGKTTRIIQTIQTEEHKTQQNSTTQSYTTQRNTGQKQDNSKQPNKHQHRNKHQRQQPQPQTNTIEYNTIRYDTKNVTRLIKFIQPLLFKIFWKWNVSDQFRSNFCCHKCFSKTNIPFSVAILDIFLQLPWCFLFSHRWNRIMMDKIREEVARLPDKN